MWDQRAEIRVRNETLTWRLIQHLYRKKWNCDLGSEGEGGNINMKSVKWKILNIFSGHKKGISDMTLRYYEIRNCAISTLH
jgi:hypothetical protein